jgi:hypothetical protein
MNMMRRVEGWQKRIAQTVFWGFAFFLALESIASYIRLELSKTAVWNGTKEDVRYSVVLDRPGEKPSDRVIPPDGVDLYPGDSVLKLAFQRNGKELVYRLSPGVQYAFRQDERKKLDVYVEEREGVSSKYFVPFVVTPTDVVEKMLEMAQVGKDDVFYDLGCGDGRLVIAAARDFGARGIGVDIDPLRVKESKNNARKAQVEHLVEFHIQDVSEADFSDATVVALYMLAEVNGRLRPRFEKQLKPGTRVVSHNYPVPGWASRLLDFESMKAEDGEEHILYLYLVW